MSHWYYSREGKTGIRAWWHFGHRACVHTEINWWTHFCHAGVSCDDEGWTVSLALPPLAIWLVFDGCGLWLPQRNAIASWETPPREIRLPDQRECKVSVHDWTIRLNPWSKSMEWAKADPWWVRGVSLNIPDLIFGRTRCVVEKGQGKPVLVPMPEGVYHAVATPERYTWKRPRWFAHSRDSVSLDIPKGIPHAGKGENSWDCGDDGLFGISGATVENAIARAVETVLRDRRRYGHASPKAVTEALASSERT